MISKGISEKTEAAINGDIAAMGALFQWYRPQLYAHALRVCGNTPLAQDALQETFISALTHLSSLRNSEVFYPWLRKILLNNCRLLLRKEKSLLNRTIGVHTDSFIKNAIDEHFEKSANQQFMYDALNQLSDELCSCVLLRYFSNFNSYEDIALILDVPVGTVRSRLSAARQKLTTFYKRYEEANDNAFSQSRQWSDYYLHLWGNIYDDCHVRNEFFNHLQTTIDIHFTSGRTGKGRALIEKDINEDFVYGTRFNVAEVSSCGNISIVEGTNFNPPEHPDRCPASTVFVAIRKQDKIDLIHIFNSPRSSPK